MADDKVNIENVLKNEITIHYAGEEYLFKIPSVRDRIRIAAEAAKIRKDNDPDGNGVQLGYDPTSVMLTDRIATFTVLIKNASAKWVYQPSAQGPFIDIDKWPDDVPVMEVVDQFNNELAEFRAKGDRPAE